MRISYLAEFLILCEKLNFNEAAADQHISQSALSKHLRALEEDLGTELLERDRQHVMLTATGELFRIKAQSIVNSYEDVKQVFRADAQNQHRVVVGGLVDSPTCYTWISNACSTLSSTYPDFKVHFVPVSSTAPVMQVINNEVDCAVMTYQATDYPTSVRNELKAVRIAECPVLAVMPIDSDLSRKSVIARADLQGRSFVRMINPRMTSGWMSIQRFLRRNGITYETRDVQVFSPYDIAQLQLDGMLLLLPAHDIRWDLMASAGKTVRALDVEFPTTPIDVVFRKRDADGIVKAFANQLKQTPLTLPTLAQ